MIGALLLALSWLLLRLEGRGLRALGFDQPRRRAREAAVGILFLGGVAPVQHIGHALAAGDAFVPNPALEPRTLLERLRFTVNSVLYEELLFRGYLLHRAIRWLGAPRAVLLDAAVFGVYHWFSYGAFGNPVLLAYLLLMTGAMGFMWARAFVVTGSVVAPIALHFGWNAISHLVFSAGPLGAALLVPRSGNPRVEVSGWASLRLDVVLPLLAVGLAERYFRRSERRRAQARAEPVGPAAVEHA